VLNVCASLSLSLCDHSYDLCTACFQLDFPEEHPHPRESFAILPIAEDLGLPLPRCSVHVPCVPARRD
jgi:hypothetical protein